jgi:hypothetical protein
MGRLLDETSEDKGALDGAPATLLAPPLCLVRLDLGAVVARGIGADTGINAIVHAGLEELSDACEAFVFSQRVELGATLCLGKNRHVPLLKRGTKHSVTWKY